MRDEAARPLWSRFLFWPFKGEPSFPQIVGDMGEEFGQRLADDGAEPARRWLRREVWRTFWTLAWRRETGYVLGISLLTSIVLYPTGLTLAVPAARIRYSHVEWAIATWLGTTLLLGLAAGAITGRLQGGHARLGRLTLVVIVAISSPVAALVYWVQVHPNGTMVLLSAVSVRRVMLLASIWLGSLWMERRHHRRASLKSAE